MAVTGLILRTALISVHAIGKQMRGFDELAAGADAALRGAPPGLTPAGAAAFLATCAQESDYFRTTTEYARGQRYAPYIGRGFVQCTWEDNYRRFGAYCHARRWVDDPLVFVRNPAALSDYRWAWATALWYFEHARLWPYANRGDFLAVSQGVNRGVGAIGTGKLPNGWEARRSMYGAFLAAGAVLLPAGRGADTGLQRRRALLLN